MPKYVSSAKQAAASKIPARFGGTGGGQRSDPAADGTVTGAQDDIAPDGNLVYPVDGGSPSVNGIRYTPDTPETDRPEARDSNAGADDVVGAGVGWLC